jgi:hypothetical protein
MKTSVTITAVFCLAMAASAVAEDKRTDVASVEPFKQLVGEWVGKEVKGPHAGMDISVSYKVTSGGSAVVETIFPGSEHEMVTVIHPDGDSLLLTHYCMLGNQPQMRAPAKITDGKIAFKFVKATNLHSDKDPHMHDATYTFIDKDSLKTEWTLYGDGKPAGQAEFELKRKK